MSNTTLSQGGWVKSFVLDDFLSKKLGDRSLKGKYMACFNGKFPSGRALERDFIKWAKKDLIDECRSNRGPMSLSDAQKVANVL